MAQLPKHYSLVKEHPQSYEIHDKRDDSKFHIAKAHLDLPMHAKLAALPHFDEGGIAGVSPSEASSLENYFGAQQAAPEYQSPADQQRAEYAKLIPQIPAQAAPTEPASPATQVVAAGTQPLEPNNIMGQFRGNEQVMETGARGVGEAQKAQADEEAAARADSNQKLQEFMDRAKDERTDFEWKNNKLAEEVADTKIDPQNYIHKMGTGNAILAGISMALSGLGSGMSGQPNLAYASMQKAIEQDIDAQKENLGTKKSLLSYNLQKYNDMRMAQQATFLQMQAMAQGQVAQIAAKHGGAIDQSKTQLLLGQMKQDALMKGTQLQQGLMQYGIAQHATTTGVPTEALPMIDEKTRPNMVQIPNGLWANAGSPANAEAVNKATSSYHPLISDLQELKSINNLGTTISQAQRDRATTLQGRIVVGLNDMAQAHRISEADLGFQEGQLSDPKSIMNKLSTDWNASTDTLMNSLGRKMDSVYRTYVPAYGKSQKVGAPAPEIQTRGGAKYQKVPGGWIPAGKGQ